MGPPVCFCVSELCLFHVLSVVLLMVLCCCFFKSSSTVRVVISPSLDFFGYGPESDVVSLCNTNVSKTRLLKQTDFERIRDRAVVAHY